MTEHPHWAIQSSKSHFAEPCVNGRESGCGNQTGALEVCPERGHPAGLPRQLCLGQSGVDRNRDYGYSRVEPVSHANANWFLVVPAQDAEPNVIQSVGHWEVSAPSCRHRAGYGLSESRKDVGRHPHAPPCR
jgi:hypothetical protein